MLTVTTMGQDNAEASGSEKKDEDENNGGEGQKVRKKNHVQILFDKQ
jgi:hypothetical protein